MKANVEEGLQRTRQKLSNRDKVHRNAVLQFVARQAAARAYQAKMHQTGIKTLFEDDGFL